MFGKTWYHGTIRRYVVLFGTIFNDIRLNRVDENDNVKQVIKVPLHYSPKEKMLARLEGDPDLDNQVAMTLPRMGFEITGFNYASERKLNTINRTHVREHGTNTDLAKYYYNPVPYDLSISLYVMVKYVEDGTRILEQILPYFTPEHTTTIKILDDPVIVKDIPIVLTGMSSEDLYEGNYDERRVLTWQLDFTLKGYLFGPEYRTDVIKKAYTNLMVPNPGDTIEESIGVIDPSEYILVYPGLDANGNPTTDANVTGPANNISKDDNWGFITEFSGPIIYEANT